MRSQARRQSRPLGSRGIALAIVLWFIAGMSLLVAGIVLSARSDARLAQIHVQRAQATALGDGAINLLLADVAEGRFASGGTGVLPRGVYGVGDNAVAVVSLPVRWMFDANAADPAMWTQLLRYTRALSAAGAKTLGDAVVQWRLGLTGGGARRFETLEDLLSVEGMNRTSWENIRDYVAAERGGSGQNAAGQNVRRELDRLRLYSPAWRLRSPDLLGPADMAVNAESSGGQLRVDALVSLGERVWLRRRWVSLNTEGSGLPWSVRRSEPARIVVPLALQN